MYGADNNFYSCVTIFVKWIVDNNNNNINRDNKYNNNSNNTIINYIN